MRFLLPRSARAAFSLIELIVVISIITLISLFVVPAATTIILGSDLTRASQMLTGQLALARQVAVTKNHAVEVRFIKYPDPEVPGEDATKPDSWRYRSIMLMEVLENGAMIQVGKLETLPGSVMFDAKRLSSILDTTQQAESNQRAAVEVDASAVYTDKQNGGVANDAPPLPRVPKDNAKNYRYVAFRYLPDGSTNLPLLPQPGLWYVTMYNKVDEARLNASGAPNINYFTAQVDPASGAVRTFRPTAGSAKTGGTATAGGGS